MNTLASPSPEAYVIEYPQTQAAVIGCVDKRRPSDHDEVLGGLVYYQMGGAGYGLATVTALAAEMQQPDCLKRGNVDVHSLGQVAARALAKSGVSIVIHEACAAINHNETIAGLIANDEGELLTTGTAFEPGLEARDHEKVVDAADRFLQAGRIKQGETVYSAMTASTHEHPGLGCAKLHDTTQAAHGFASILEPGHAFDVAAADAQGHNFYVATRGGVELASRAVNEYLGIKPEYFMAAAGVYHAAVHRGLEAVTKHSLPLHVVGQAA